jgi:hypothetical protein
MDSLRDACAVGDIRFFGGRALVREQATESQAVHQGKCLRVQVLRHGRDVHPTWVNVVTTALALKSFGGQVMRAEVMLESREGSGF